MALVMALVTLTAAVLRQRSVERRRPVLTMALVMTTATAL